MASAAEVADEAAGSLQANLSLALLDHPLQLAYLDPAASPLKYTLLNGTLPFAGAEISMSGMALDSQYTVAAGGNLYSVFLPAVGNAPEVDVHEVGAFIDPSLLSAKRAMEYFV